MHVDLSTADQEGRRKWIFPHFLPGFWYKSRAALAALLLLWLFAAPWIRVNSKQGLFFDLLKRKIDFLGFTIFVNETLIILAFIFSVGALILLFTALLGRVFCGWACPFTVFMEFVFRPIERFFEGHGHQQRSFQSRPVSNRWLPSLGKWTVFAIIAFAVGNTFVAYFLGSDRLLDMIWDGPFAHPTPFISMLVVSGLVLFQFGWFREQICLFVCPYGRLQSLLLDKDSLIVAYDRKRGELRGKPSDKAKNPQIGDCVDCHLCVKVCPTGIDIRNGLQLECIHCTQCMDACDSVMTKLQRPTGLIRYQTEHQVEGAPKRIFRPRVAVYGFFLLICSASLFGLAAQREEFRVTVHRESGRPVFTVDDTNFVTNPIRLQISNRTDQALRIAVTGVHPKDLRIVQPELDQVTAPQGKSTQHILVQLPRSYFKENFGLRDIEFKARNENGKEVFLKLRMIGPAN